MPCRLVPEISHMKWSHHHVSTKGLQVDVGMSSIQAYKAHKQAVTLCGEARNSMNNH